MGELCESIVVFTIYQLWEPLKSEHLKRSKARLFQSFLISHVGMKKCIIKEILNSMCIFRFVNVGQGDCCILRAPSNCEYSNEVFYVDLGNGVHPCDITKYINMNDEINIILTHHHDDHIGGLRFFLKRINQIKKIFLPCCQNEIILIANAILNLKGITESDDCQELIDEFRRDVYNHLALKDIINDSNYRFYFMHDGKNLCGHIRCLNPPAPRDANDITYDEYNNLYTIIDHVFNTIFADNLKEYFNRETFDIYQNINERNRNDEIVQENVLKYQDIYISNELPYQKTIVKDFILNNAKYLMEYNQKKNKAKLMKIYKKYKNYTHDFCIVLKVEFNDRTMLLTGDASKKVFNRLIREGNNIVSYYLKMPHHGSKDNIDQKIINAIRPKKVIISHNNGKFGKSNDWHPNVEVLDLLEKNKIEILLTNDVIKNGKIVKKKQNKYKDGFVEIL